MELARDERRLDSSTVRTSLLFFWLKTSMLLTNKRLAGTVPNTVLLAFPAGRRDITQPLNRISNVAFETKFHIFRFLFGALFVVTSVTQTVNRGYQLNLIVFLIVGLLLLGWSWVASLSVADNSGNAQKIPVSVLDRDEVDRFANVVNRTLADSDSSPRSRTQPASAPERPDRIEQLQRLSEMRSQGVLSQEEFDNEKRRLLES